ncbi:predicted protein, partial [Nematostella vectensis]
EANRKAHNTAFEQEGLIVRRGQEFELTIKFDRNYNADTDQLTLQLVTGERPQQSKGTIVRIKEHTATTRGSWSMEVTSVKGGSVSVKVMSPATAPIGKYQLYVETEVKGAKDGKKLRFRSMQAVIIVLFNAWCKDDDVYMGDESHRQEYVMNETGRIWVGSSRNNYGRPWNFGQFEDVVLENALYLLDKAELGISARSSPVAISRVISQMANHNDRDGGILYGRWTEKYPKNSTKPWDWVGSVKILEKFDRRKYTVRYGQCWVFSGLVTTLCRALGIPTRSVTNFKSAHDTDSSMTIDFHFDEAGEPMDDLDDSVWNFHVWNESFFKRPDLPAGYDGWQVHDATPQETSEGVFRCGPCPVKAVKNGEVYVPYDTKFVFAEVNGDRVYWDVHSDGEMEVYRIDKQSIGKNISTKAVGSDEREDITHLYKFPEGDHAEREAVHLAHKYSSRRDEDIYEEKRVNDVTFALDVKDDVIIGSDFDVVLKMTNTSKEKRTVKIAMTAKSTFYTGRSNYNVTNLKDEVELEANKDETIILAIKQADYVRPKQKCDEPMNIFVRAHVQQTDQRYASMETATLKKPVLKAMVKILAWSPSGEEFEMKFYFTNPLPIKLTDISFDMEASRVKPRSLEKTPVGPNEKATVTITFKSSRRGKREITATFSCDQLGEITESFNVRIK